jgi:hypothetical protein
MADKDPASTSTTAEISGKILIGSNPDKHIEIPISIQLPPKEGEFRFSYEEPNVEMAEKIPVGEFITWTATQLGSNVKDDDLPESLRDLNIAVKKLQFSTKGDFDIKVEIGKDSSGKWDAKWTPIDGLGLSIANVGLEVTKGVKKEPASQSPSDGTKQ